MDRTPVIAGIGLSDYPVGPGPRRRAAPRARRPAGDRRLRHREVGHRRLHERRGRRRDDGRRRRHHGRVPPHRPPLHRRHDDRRLVVRVPRPARSPPRSATALCDTILVTYGSDQLSRMGRMLGTGGFARGVQKVGGPHGVRGAVRQLARRLVRDAAQRHMHEYGTTSEQLAEIAVGVREFAGLNPNAMYRDPITVDDVVELAHDRRPAAHARLLRDHRRRRRVDHDHGRAGQGPRRSRRSTCSARPVRRRTGTSAR